MWKISQPRMLDRCGLENIRIIWNQYYPATLSPSSSHDGICDNHSDAAQIWARRLPVVLFVLLILGLTSDLPVV